MTVATTPKLRVVSLMAQNMLRLSAVNFAWTDDNGAIVTIGGLNGAGKSSVINCVAMALGGAALCPEEPIKRGELKGFVELDLSELRIKREFWREIVHQPTCMTVKKDVDFMDEAVCNCTPTYGDTKSRLVVRNADGITQGTPQAILDKLVGRMTFDPMAFVNEDAKRQAEALRKIVNLDVTEHEQAQRAAFERRTALNRSHKDALAVLESMTTYDEAPAEEISMDEVSKELRDAEDLRTAAANASSLVTVHESKVAFAETRERQLRDSLTELDAQIRTLKASIEEAEQRSATERKQLQEVQAQADVTKAAVPNVATIQARLSSVETTNKMVRANRAYLAAADGAKKLAEQIAEQTTIITDAENAKRKALDEAKFPVNGLSFDEHGVTFNGLPFKQASTAEQIRVSVAIGFALHPKFKLLLVRNGNALDEHSMKLIADEAAAAGGQVLMEYVTKNADDVSVFIEDGHNT